MAEGTAEALAVMVADTMAAGTTEEATMVAATAAKLRNAKKRLLLMDAAFFNSRIPAAFAWH
jgi:Mrp family chromosome partitioning ATPase